jgi:hypothetical protein
VTLTSVLTRPATIALAAAAFVAPAASARPADTRPANATEAATAAAAAVEHKDARRPANAAEAAAAAAEHTTARPADANAGSRQRHAGIGAARGYPARPAQGKQANPRADSSPQAPIDRGIAWTTIAIGLAGSLLAVGAIAGIAVHARHAGHAHIRA